MMISGFLFFDRMLVAGLLSWYDIVIKKRLLGEQKKAEF